MFTRAFTRTTLVLALGLLAAGPVAAQSVSPEAISSDPSAACGGGTEQHQVCITLPADSVADEVDVFLLFDDTGSFANQIPPLTLLFDEIVDELQTALPAVDFAFGVGRYEDYGGPGSGFALEEPEGRPFILNQALIRTANPTFEDDIHRALTLSGFQTPGTGGDPLESSMEGLAQVATGAGFDGNGDGSTDGSGPAGAFPTQVFPGVSGDVPAFASYVGTGDGTLGGAGFRPGAQRLVLLVADTCTVAVFDADLGIPASITGTGSTEPTTAFDCAFGPSRFGFVSDSKTLAGNTIPDAVAPLGAATVPGAIEALNGLGLQVIGLGPGAAPTTDPGPSLDESVFLSAVARLTGAVDSGGTALVFDIAGDTQALADAIVASVLSASTSDIDVTLTVDDGACEGLSVTALPDVIEGVSPGETACFDVSFTGDETFDGCDLQLAFRNAASNAVLGAVPVSLGCEPAECLLVVGDGPGSADYFDIGHLFTTQLDDVEGAYEVLLDDVAEFVLPVTAGRGRGVSAPLAGGQLGHGTLAAGLLGDGPLDTTPAWMQDGEFAVQILMWNPQVFPGQPEQFSAGLSVRIRPDGTVLTTPFGTDQGGIQVWHELDTNAAGQRVIRFPFSIPGFEP